MTSGGAAAPDSPGGIRNLAWQAYRQASSPSPSLSLSSQQCCCWGQRWWRLGAHCIFRLSIFMRSLQPHALPRRHTATSTTSPSLCGALTRLTSVKTNFGIDSGWMRMGTSAASLATPSSERPSSPARLAARPSRSTSLSPGRHLPSARPMPMPLTLR